jgi:hypothetical protein
VELRCPAEWDAVAKRLNVTSCATGSSSASGGSASAASGGGSGGCGCGLAAEPALPVGSIVRHGPGPAAEALGVLEGIAAHVGDDPIALVLDLVEEGAAGGDVVDGAGEGVDVRARVELDGIEHLLGGDVARGAGDEAAAGLGRDADGAHHAEVDDDRGERGARAGFAVLLRVEPLAAGERQAQPEVGGLDVAVDEAGAVQRREARAGLEHDLAQLVEDIRRAPEYCLRSAPIRYSSTRKGTSPEDTPRSMMLATLGW